MLRQCGQGVSLLVWIGVRAMEGSGGSGVGWALSGTHFHNTNAGNLGIRISTPNERLHLHNAATGNTH